MPQPEILKFIINNMRTRGILSVVAIAGVAGLLALYTRTGPVSG
jgi:hypothetical protein